MDIIWRKNVKRITENAVSFVFSSFMKGSWKTSAAVGGVLLVLTLFLGLQYNWLRQAGDAERDRMQKRVETDAKNFADDFNREIQGAYFNFQMDAAKWEASDWAEFNQRYDYWKEKTQYPDLVRGFVFLGKAPGDVKLYNVEKRVFEPAELPAELASLTDKIKIEKDFKPYYDDEHALVMPVHNMDKQFERILIDRPHDGGQPIVRMPEQHGFLVIELDPAVLTGRILPDLTKKYFSEGGFRVDVANVGGASVFQTAGHVSSPDAKGQLFDLSPDNFVFFADRGMLPSEGQPGVVRERVESRTFSHVETRGDGTNSRTVTVDVQPSTGHEIPKMRTSVIASRANGTTPWVLNVEHTAGSIDAFVRNEQNKSFAIGIGLYIFLVGAIVAILLSALRSKRFAQQQIDFVSSVSHEFRTPLAVIYSAGENLADGVTKNGDQVARYGDLIKGEGKKLSEMVEQILEFAGARSGRKKYYLKPTDVTYVARKALAECGALLKEKGFEIETSIPDHLPSINADADALSSAIQNLIRNSVKYSGENRWISVTASNGANIRLTVADRGIGVADDDLRHVFEPFYRAKSVVDAQIHGNGLGLALVKEIAEAHGGAVSAESELGKGSKFMIELPRD